MTHIERAADLLFPAEGPRTLNVKFLCAGNVTADALAEQIVRAEVQIRHGHAKLVADVDQDLCPPKS